MSSNSNELLRQQRRLTRCVVRRRQDIQLLLASGETAQSCPRLRMLYVAVQQDARRVFELHGQIEQAFRAERRLLDWLWSMTQVCLHLCLELPPARD
jgi:hypothetical protein